MRDDVLNTVRIARKFQSQKLISRSLQSGAVDSILFQPMDSKVGRE